jgi:ABC-type arginine/histidine transport system permease subunit
MLARVLSYQKTQQFLIYFLTVFQSTGVLIGLFLQPRGIGLLQPLQRNQATAVDN